MGLRQERRVAGREILIGLILVLVAGIVAAQTKDTLTIGLPFDIPTPDMHKATGLPAIGLDAQVAEVLVLGKGEAVIPWLADRKGRSCYPLACR